MTRSWILVLTGGAASGKSTVGRFFSQWGAKVIDTDVIARTLTGEAGEALPALREAFGEKLVPDTGLDRSKMRDWVFTDPSIRQRLEAILHPLIRKHQADKIASPPFADVTVLEIPLFFETGMSRVGIDRVLTIECPTPIRRMRLLEHRYLSLEIANALLAAQAHTAERRSIADDVIENDGNVAKMARLSAYYFQYYLAYANLKRHGHL